MGQALYCSVADAAGGKREAMVMAPPPCWLSSIALLPWCPAFLHRLFPPQSPPSHPLDQSLCSQQQPSPWDCSTTPKLQLPATVPSRGPAFLSGICMVLARIVWFSFLLGCYRSAVSLSVLNVSPLTQTIAPMWGLDPCPHLPRAGPVLLILLFSPQFLRPTKFCMVLYILCHWSGPQLVFCKHFCVWRCISDVSMERDVLHVHLLLCRLVLSP